MVACRHQRFGLTVGLDQRHAGGTNPAFEHLRIDRLAGRDREPEPAEIVRAEVFVDEVPELGGRAAEHGHTVTRDQGQPAHGIEAAVVEQYRAAARPGPEQDAGAGLGPAGVGRAPHQIVRLQIQPAPGRNAPAVQGARGMCDALGHAGRPRGVEQQRRFIEAHVRAREVAALVLQGLLEVQPAGRTTDGDARAHPRHAFKLFHLRSRGDGCHRSRMRGAVKHVLACQHVDAGNRNGAELQAANHGDLPLRQTWQHHKHPLSAPHTPAGKQVGELAGLAADLAKGIAQLRTGLVAPDQREFVRLFGRDGVDDVAAEVEGLRQLPSEVGIGRLVTPHAFVHRVSPWFTPHPRKQARRCAVRCIPAPAEPARCAGRAVAAGCALFRAWRRT